MKRLIDRAYLVLMVHSKVGSGRSGESRRSGGSARVRRVRSVRGVRRVREGQEGQERQEGQECQEGQRGSGGFERVILQITTIPELYTQTGAGRRVLPSFDDLRCIKR